MQWQAQIYRCPVCKDTAFGWRTDIGNAYAAYPPPRWPVCFDEDTEQSEVVCSIKCAQQWLTLSPDKRPVSDNTPNEIPGIRRGGK